MTAPQEMPPGTVETLVRLQVSRVYDVWIQHRPDQDPIAIVDSGELQTTVIGEYGDLEDVELDFPEVWGASRPVTPSTYQPDLYFGHLSGYLKEEAD